MINSASGRCWSSEVYNPCPGVLDGVPSSNNYQGGFGTALMTKVRTIHVYSGTGACHGSPSPPPPPPQDLGLSQTVANETGTATPLGSLALQIYRLMNQSGYSDKDFSSVFKFLEEQS